MTPTKTTAKSKLDNVFTSNGWEVDATPHQSGPHYYRQKKPLVGAYVKQYTDGSVWRVHADHGDTGQRISAVYFGLFHVDDSSKRLDTLLHNGREVDSKGWSEDNRQPYGILAGLARVRAEQGFALRKLVEWIAADPESAAAAALEADEAAHAQRAAQRAAQDRENQERRRPLPLKEGTQWSALQAELRAASNAVAGADGRTDLPAAVARLQAITEQIAASLAQ